MNFILLIQVLTPVPLAIENTQPHDPVVLGNLGDTQQINTSTTNQNNEIAIPNEHDGNLNILT